MTFEILFGIIAYIFFVVENLFSVTEWNDTNKAHQKRWVEKVLLIQQKENNDE